MFKKIGDWFDKHPVLGKVIICAGSYAAFLGFIAIICKISNLNHPESAWAPNDDFETHEGELAENFQKVQEFIKTLKMIPGEEFYIECDDLNREHVTKIFLSQMFLGDEIAFFDF